MSEKRVIILDSDSTQVEYYQSYLAEYSVQTVNYQSIDDFFANLQGDSFFLLLISYQIILASERAQVIELFQKLQDREIVVYDVPENANRRLAFYDLGSRRVYDTSYSPQEVSHSLRWLIHILSSEERAADVSSRGRLEDVPVQSLILLLGRENRTGVLKLLGTHNSGKIYFFNGNIDAAQVGTHNGKEAVLHMLLWQKGNFVFSPADHLAQETKISLSNFGFIIMARTIRREMAANLRQIGSEKTVLRVQYLGDLLQSDLEIDPRFAEYIKTPRLLASILENPVYNSFETAEKLALLKNKGYLSVNEPAERNLAQKIPRAEEEAASQLALPATQIEIDLLKQNLHIGREQKSVKLIVLFSPQAADSDAVKIFVPEMIETPHTEIKGITQLTLSADFNIYLLGMVADQSSIDFILNLDDHDFSGYIFLIDATAESFFEYGNYLINHLLSNKPLPAAVALSGAQDEQQVSELKGRFFTPDGLTWLACPQDRQEALHLVLAAVQDIKQEQPEEEEEQQAQNEAASEALPDDPESPAEPEKMAEAADEPAAQTPDEEEPEEQASAEEMKEEER